MLFIALIDRFFEPIRDLSQQYNMLQAAMAAGERIFEVLDVEPEVRDKPDAYVAAADHRPGRVTTMSPSATARPRSCTTSICTCSRARRSPSSARPAPARAR